MPLYRRSFVDWSQGPMGFIVPRRWNYTLKRWEKETAPIVWQPHQIDLFRWAFTLGEDDRFPIDEFFYIDVGQSGKSMFQAALAQWIGLFHEADSHIQLAANSREQVGGRVYAQLLKSVRRSPLPKLFDANGERIKFIKTGNEALPLPLNAATIAGGSPVMRGLDEPWDWRWANEADRDMAAEFKPTSARNISILIVTSYPSYKDIDGYLNDAFGEFVDTDGEPLPGVGRVKNLETLPLLVKGRSAFWWNRDPKLYPWNTDAFIRAQIENKRTSEAATQRIWFAAWVEREHTFLPMDAWRDCEDSELSPLDEDDRTVPMVLGVDAGWKLDHGAGISRGYDSISRRYPLYADVEWNPKDYKNGGIIAAMEQWVSDMHKRHRVLAVYYDPREFVGSAERLRKIGVNMVEVVQNNMRLEADTNYRALIAERTLRNYPECGKLTDHVRSAVGVEREEGIRISKKKSSSHIDLAVADSMACWGVTQLREKFERLARLGTTENPLANWKNPYRNLHLVNR